MKKKFLDALVVVWTVCTFLIQDHATAADYGPEDLKRNLSLIQIAKDGSDHEIALKFPHDRGNLRTFSVNSALQNGEPHLVFTTEAFGFGEDDYHTAMILTCDGNKNISLSLRFKKRDKGKILDPNSDEYWFRYRLNSIGPLKFIRFGKHKSAWFHVAVPSSDDFWKFFDPSESQTTFKIDLIANSRAAEWQLNTHIERHSDTIAPLVRKCAGLPPLAPSAKMASSSGKVGEPSRTIDKTIKHSPGILWPNKEDIRRAIQAHVNGVTGAVDTMAAQCDTMERSQNPVSALMCLMSGGKMLTSQTVGIEIIDANIIKCMAVSEGGALCNYSLKTKSASDNPFVAGVLQLASMPDRSTWGFFERQQSGWKISKYYDSCQFNEKGAQCTESVSK